MVLPYRQWIRRWSGDYEHWHVERVVLLHEA